MSFLQQILARLLAPEEHRLADAVEAAYPSEKAAIVAQLEAQGITAPVAAAVVVKAAVDPAIAKAAGSFAVVLQPLADRAVDSLAANLVSQIPADVNVAEAFADHLVAEVVAKLRAA